MDERNGEAEGGGRKLTRRKRTKSNGDGVGDQREWRRENGGCADWWTERVDEKNGEREIGGRKMKRRKEGFTTDTLGESE